MIESRCGLCCDTCEYKAGLGCKGCLNFSQPPWGQCPIKTCCEGKGYRHCGDCENFSCKQLIDFSNDKEHGDQGRRILQCQKWKQEEEK